MAGYVRPRQPSPIHLLALMVFWCTTSNQLAAGTNIPNLPEMLDDAELTDVCFVDFDRGWTVGDRGAIWTTDDGGRNWTRQRSGVTCRLTSVHFLDTQTGWAVGGEWHPYTHQGTGVVLRTRDGGHRWERLPSPSLAAIKKVKFFDTRRGWLHCHTSPLCSSGVMRSDDGGRSWSEVPCDGSGNWQAADWVGQFGTAIGSEGYCGQIHGPKLTLSQSPRLGLAGVHQIGLTASRTGWLVGDGGLAMFTPDGGQSWTAPPQSLPVHTSRHFDFHAVAVHKSHCWIAGSPGTRVFHSPDNGRSWHVYRTEQTLPVYGLDFLDEDHGWAVGAMGTILTTRDAGKTWRRSTRREKRATILGIFSDPEQVPWELVARLAGNDGYLTAIELLNRRDIEDSSVRRDSLRQRSHQAVILAGGSASNAAWQFPVRQRQLAIPSSSIIDGWSTDSGGADRMKEYLIAKIRQWRPDIVVTVPVKPEAHDPLAHLINQFVLKAIQEAGNPQAMQDQQSAADLAPWKVKKAFCEATNRQLTSIQLVTTQLAPRLGQSLTQVGARARAMFVSGPDKIETMASFRLLYHDLPDDLARRDFMSGLALTPGSDARRQLTHTSTATIDRLRRLVQRRRNIEQIIARTNDEQTSLSWLGQVQDLIRGQARDDAASILFQLGHSYRQLGRGDLAAEVLQHLVERYRQHELAAAAAVWLIQYHTSGEHAWQLRKQSGGETQTLVTRPPWGVHSDPSQEVQSAGTFHANPTSQTIQRVNHEVAMGGAPDPQLRARRALAVEAVLKESWPSLVSIPQIRFPLAVASRSIGGQQDIQRQFSMMARQQSLGVWSECARAESALQARRENSPLKPVYACVQSATKPHLDGLLHDPVWQEAERIQLRSTLHDDAQWPGMAMIAHDDQFLYVAVSCRKASIAEYPTSDAARPRDPDLSQRDRIDLLIDLDRDYATYYRLTVDHRGWTGESCCGDASWNPQWFVASAPESDDTWTIEAAIALSELSDSRPSRQSPWAVGVQRTVPRVGFQSWTSPARIHPIPAGFGWLIFSGHSTSSEKTPDRKPLTESR